jgi:hypothetical protein
MIPADITIVPRQFDHGHAGAVKKTSDVTVSRPIGGDLKLGLFIGRRQRVSLSTSRRPRPPMLPLATATR